MFRLPCLTPIRSIDKKIFQSFKFGNRVYAIESVPNVQKDGKFDIDNVKTSQIVVGFGSYYGKGSIALLNTNFEIMTKLDQHFSHIKCLKFICLLNQQGEILPYLASGGGDNTIII